jgi:DNA-binding NtrC family response regulator
MATLTEPGKLVGAASRRKLSVCVVGSNVEEAEAVSIQLQRAGFSTLCSAGPREALENVRGGACRVVIVVDLNTPGMGLVFLDDVLQIDPGACVIVVTECYAVEAAIEAVKHGAYDFLSKPVDFRRLEKALDELVDLSSQRTHIRDLEEELFQTAQFHGIVGKGPAMLEVLDLARKVARHYSNVLVTGPTGSGKELVARALHQLSPVADQRFVVCNCSALVDTLLESQLFGHVRGSFTGATDTRAGLFEYGNHGTVFLDEIGETSLQMQAKLLRVIQNREIQRVGSPEVKHVNVRLIAATNRDLRTEVAAGRFREDLFYRLSSIEIRVPGLTERPEDIPVLIRHFLKKYNQVYGKLFQGLTRRAQIALMRYDWPGNVRELENVVAGAAITASADFIDVGDLPQHLQRPHGRLLGVDESWHPLPLKDLCRLHVQRVLDLCHGNRVRTAEVLGVGRTSLYRYLKRNSSQPQPSHSSHSHAHP